MFNYSARLLQVLILVSLSASNFAANDVHTILRDADRFRLPADSVQVKTRILLYKNGKLDKERRYDVFLKPGRRSLVLFRHTSEHGQKMLMLDDKFWMLMPKSRRPIRVTAMQKLLGEASAGDIATMTWSEDYDAKIAGAASINGSPALELVLDAKRKGVTYKRIELMVDEKDHHPLSAKLYVSSGKLTKEAVFIIGQSNGRKAVIATTLIDRVQKQKKTVIEYLGTEPRSISDKYFNPAYLVRNTLDEL